MDLSESGPPPARSEGLGPPHRKQKHISVTAVTQPLHSRYSRIWSTDHTSLTGSTHLQQPAPPTPLSHVASLADCLTHSSGHAKLSSLTPLILSDTAPKPMQPPTLTAQGGCAVEGWWVRRRPRVRLIARSRVGPQRRSGGQQKGPQPGQGSAARLIGGL